MEGGDSNRIPFPGHRHAAVDEPRTESHLDVEPQIMAELRSILRLAEFAGDSRRGVRRNAPVITEVPRDREGTC